MDRIHFTTSCAWLVLATAALGCKSSGAAGDELRANLDIDMAHVAGFVLTQGAGGAPSSPASYHPAGEQGGGGAASAGRLYALNEDGTLTVVTVTSGGSASETVTPLALFDTATYLLIDYQGVSHAGDTCNFVAARKADGALYCVTAPGIATPDMSQRSRAYGSLVQSDATGNVVWINHDDGVTLLDLRDPSAPTQQTPAGVASSNPNDPPPDGPFAMAVNGAGDALLSDLHMSSHYTRVFFPAGGFFGVSSTLESCVVAGASASPDDFYYSADTAPATLVELTPASASTFTKTTVTVTDTVTPASSSTFYDCSAGFAVAGAHVFLTASASPANRLVDVTGDTANVLSVDALSSLTEIEGCDASLFLLGVDDSGNGGVVRYDVAGGAFTTLVAPGAYALTAMAVSPGCEVTFYGQRAADGAYILGTIPAGSDQVTVNAAGFPAVSQIARIR